MAEVVAAELELLCALPVLASGSACTASPSADPFRAAAPPCPPLLCPAFLAPGRVAATLALLSSPPGAGCESSETIATVYACTCSSPLGLLIATIPYEYPGRSFAASTSSCAVNEPSTISEGFTKTLLMASPCALPSLSNSKIVTSTPSETCSPVKPVPRTTTTLVAASPEKCALSTRSEALFATSIVVSSAGDAGAGAEGVAEGLADAVSEASADALEGAALADSEALEASLFPVSADTLGAGAADDSWGLGVTVSVGLGAWVFSGCAGAAVGAFLLLDS